MKGVIERVMEEEGMQRWAQDKEREENCDLDFNAR